MKKLLMSIALFLCALAGASAQSAAGDITGKWQNPNGKAVIEMYKEKDLYYGKVVENNGGRAREGTVMFSELSPKSAHEWEGKMLVPERGKRLPCTVTLKDPETLQIAVAVMRQSKTMEWKKVE